MEALCSGDDFIKREMVLKICIKLSKFRGNDGRKGVKVDHTTIMRWVHQYSPEIEKKVRRSDIPQMSSRK
jgi:hypothetical protein